MSLFPTALEAILAIPSPLLCNRCTCFQATSHPPFPSIHLWTPVHHLSNHLPLMHLLSPFKATPAMASARLLRWALLLGAYDYKIAYKEGEKHCNADALSRLPLPMMALQVPTPPETIQLMEHLSRGPVSAAQIRQMTDWHQVLAQMKRFVQYSWPNQVDQEPEELRPYWRRREELSLHNGCLLCGGRVVVPPQV